MPNLPLDAEHRQLRRISMMAEWIALAGAAVVAASVAYLWATPGAWLAHLAKGVPGAPQQLDAALLMGAAGAGSIPALIFVAAMWEARNLFHQLGSGQIFAAPVATHLVRLGWLALAAALASVAVRLLVGVLLTATNPDGQRQVILAIGSDEIAAIVTGLLFLAFALIVKAARRLDEDSRSIV